jgi:hypothetical protein
MWAERQRITTHHDAISVKPSTATTSGRKQPVSDELTNPEFTGVITDPILILLGKHQWVSMGDFTGFCFCLGQEGERNITPHGYRLHVRKLLLELFTSTTTARDERTQNVD